MTMQIQIIFAVAFGLFVMQAVGGWFQIKNYKKAIRRMHKQGNVGIGQTKGRFLNGNLVLIACDSTGVITACEVMEGLTFLAGFKPRQAFRGRTLTGAHIDDFLADFAQYGKRDRRRYKGFVQAIEALDLRINHPERLDATESAPGTAEAVG